MEIRLPRGTPGQMFVMDGALWNKVAATLEYLSRIQAISPLTLEDDPTGPQIGIAPREDDHLLKVTATAGGSGEYKSSTIYGQADCADGTAENMPQDGLIVGLASTTGAQDSVVYNLMEDANTTPDMTGHGLAPNTFHFARLMGWTGDSHAYPIYAFRAGTYVVSQDESTYRRVRERFRYGQGLTIADDPDDPYRALLGSYVGLGMSCGTLATNTQVLPVCQWIYFDNTWFTGNIETAFDPLAPENAYFVTWDGFTVANSGTGGLTPIEPNTVVECHTQRLSFFSNIVPAPAPPSGQTRFRVQWGLTQVSTAESCSSCPTSPNVNDTHVWACVDVPNAVTGYLTVVGCGGTPTILNTTTLAFGSGFVVSGASPNAAVALNIDTAALQYYGGTCAPLTTIGTKDNLDIIDTAGAHTLAITGGSIVLTLKTKRYPAYNGLVQVTSGAGADVTVTGTCP